MHLHIFKLLLTIILMVFVILIDTTYKSGQFALTLKYMICIASILTILFGIELFMLYSKGYRNLMNQNVYMKGFHVAVIVIYFSAVLTSWLAVNNSTSLSDISAYIQSVKTFASLVIVYNFGKSGYMYYKSQMPSNYIHTGDAGHESYGDGNNDKLYSHSDSPQRFSDED